MQNQNEVNTLQEKLEAKARQKLQELKVKAIKIIEQDRVLSLLPKYPKGTVYSGWDRSIRDYIAFKEMDGILEEKLLPELINEVTSKFMQCMEDAQKALDELPQPFQGEY